MNLASLVFLQHSADILTELINDPKLSPYRAYLIEINTNIADIHKKFVRIKKNGIDDEICNAADETQKYINQVQNILQQKLVTKVRYEHLKNACKFFTIVTLADFAYALYKKQNETKYYRDNFEKLKVSVNRMLQKYDCLLNENTLNLSVPEIDIALEPFITYLNDKIIELRCK